LTLAFVKYFSPAYGFLVLRYLDQGGIRLGPNISFEAAARMTTGLAKGKDLSPYDKALRGYVEAWRQNPARRPSGRMLLKGLYGEAEPDALELTRIQERLPPEAGKLVITKDDAAAEISEFYRLYFGESLRKDLETAVGKDLFIYIEPNDEARLESVRHFGPERYEEAVRRFCNELLSSLEHVTPKVVSENIGIVFEEHFGHKDHMKRPSYYHGPNQILVCRHATQLIELSGIVSRSDADVSLTLSSARGGPLCEARGDIPTFPWYEVVDIT
jgi:hypothetical protein